VVLILSVGSLAAVVTLIIVAIPLANATAIQIVATASAVQTRCVVSPVAIVVLMRPATRMVSVCPTPWGNVLVAGV
jgi:hypothetical protein